MVMGQGDSMVRTKIFAQFRMATLEVVGRRVSWIDSDTSYYSSVNTANA